MTTRKALIAGNWKMHKTLTSGQVLAAAVAGHCNNLTDREVLLAPPFTILREISQAVADKGILTAGQNVCWQSEGAFTGEISPQMISEAGGSAAIIGHSERRQIFGESDQLVNLRLKGCLDAGLMAILCIGETLEEREAEETFAVLERQLVTALSGVAKTQMNAVVIAYEPVWAIGTGKTASTAQAQEAHAFIRRWLAEKYEKDLAEQIRILYGGSVKPSNVDDLMGQPDIDGALVGGAALDGESFGRIINYRVNN